MDKPVNANDTVKITQIGNSLGVVLPKETLTAWNLKKGDVLQMVQTTEGIKLVPYDPDFSEAMDAARDVMREYRDALHELAK